MEKIVSLKNNRSYPRLIVLLAVIAFIAIISIGGLVALLWGWTTVKPIVSAIAHCIVTVLEVVIPTLLAISYVGCQILIVYCSQRIVHHYTIALWRLRLTSRERVISCLYIAVAIVLTVFTVLWNIFFSQHTNYNSNDFINVSSSIITIFSIFAYPCAFILGLINDPSANIFPNLLDLMKVNPSIRLFELLKEQNYRIGDTGVLVMSDDKKNASILSKIDYRIECRNDSADGFEELDDKGIPMILHRMFGLSMDDLTRSRVFSELDVTIQREDHEEFEKWLDGFNEWSGLSSTVVTMSNDDRDNVLNLRVVFEAPEMTKSRPDREDMVRLINDYNQPEFSMDIH